jgi:L-histidine Nalpha-methyltransferase
MSHNTSPSNSESWMFPAEDVAINSIGPGNGVQSGEQMARRPEVADFALDVARGLSAQRKFIPSKYLYDPVGSALFEAICLLREYKCTRGETRLLQRYGARIREYLPPNTVAVELGGGNGSKALVLLTQVSDRRPITEYHNIDISNTALQASKQTLFALPHVAVFTHQTSFLSGLSDITGARLQSNPLLVMFLGSSIGNCNRAEASQLLTAIRGRLRAGDYFLLGTDLVKPKDHLISAYDDPQGVTAAFNKNVLARMNAQLGADFNLSYFRHEVLWNADLSRVEMHLASTLNQQVEITRSAMLAKFTKNESIRTETSYKYRLEEIGPWLNQCGFDVVSQWSDIPSSFATTLAAVG